MQPHDKQCVHPRFTKSSQDAPASGPSLQAYGVGLHLSVQVKLCAPATGRKAAARRRRAGRRCRSAFIISRGVRAGRRCPAVFIISRGVLLSSISRPPALLLLLLLLLAVCSRCVAARGPLKLAERPGARLSVDLTAMAKISQSCWWALAAEFSVFVFAINTVNATHTICLSSLGIFSFLAPCFGASLLSHMPFGQKHPHANSRSPMMSRSSHVP